RNHDRQRAAGTVVQDMASALFGVDGLQVIEADAERDGWVTVWVVTDHPGAAVCPECGTRSVRVHEQVLARPRDVRRGLDEVRVAWLKRRWKCGNDGCARKTFTEALPAVPARRWPSVAARWPRRPGGSASRGRWPIRSSPGMPIRSWTSRLRWWRIWGSMSTAAASPAAGPILIPGSTCCSRIAGTRASMTCPGIRGCWARWRAVPPMTPRT